MPLNTATALSVVSRRPQGGRGVPSLVTMRKTTYIAGLMEGIALADEVLDGAERIQTAAALGSRQVIANEAGRLGVKASAAKAEFHRLAEGFDE